MAAPRPGHQLAFARLILTALELAAARQEEGLTPNLQFAVQHDARVNQARVLMERERVDEAAASTLLQQAPIEGRLCEPSPSASSPMLDAGPLPAWPLPRGAFAEPDLPSVAALSSRVAGQLDERTSPPRCWPVRPSGGSAAGQLRGIRRRCWLDGRPEKP